MRARGVLDLLESAYRVDASDRDWLTGLANASRNVFPHDIG